MGGSGEKTWEWIHGVRGWRSKLWEDFPIWLAACVAILTISGMSMPLTSRYPALSFRVSVNFSTDILSFDPNDGAHWNRLLIYLSHSISAFIQPIIVIWSVTKRPSLVTWDPASRGPVQAKWSIEFPCIIPLISFLKEVATSSGSHCAFFGPALLSILASEWTSRLKFSPKVYL